MATRRVGVLSDNSSLVVALSLQATDLDIVRIATTDELADREVALVDLHEDEDPAEALSMLPPGRVVVLLSNQDVSPDGVHVVQRPYSLGDLIDMLRTAEPARAARTEREPEPADARVTPPVAASPVEQTTPTPEDAEPSVPPPSAPHPALFTSRGRPDPASVSGPAPVVEEEPFAVGVPGDQSPVPQAIDPVAVDEPVPTQPEPAAPPQRQAPQLDPIRSIEFFAQSLDAALLEAPFLMSTARFADGVAASVAADFHLDHVALWDRAGDSMRIIGAYGLSDAERRLRPHHRQPLLQQARATEGVLVENADVGSALLLGMPGSRSPSYAVILLEGSSLPVQMVTISAPELLPDVIDHVEAFIEETGSGWDAVAAVESIASRLRGA